MKDNLAYYSAILGEDKAQTISPRQVRPTPHTCFTHTHTHTQVEPHEDSYVQYALAPLGAVLSSFRNTSHFLIDDVRERTITAVIWFMALV